MNCEALENRILDYLDHQLASDTRAEIEGHLVACAACRALVRRFERLDAALAASVKPPALSAGFDQRLRQQLETETNALSEAERAERKRQLQADFEAGLLQLRRHAAPLANLPGVLGWACLIALAGWLTVLCLPAAARVLPGAAAGGLGEQYLFAAVGGVVFLAVGLIAAFPRKFQNLWAAA